MLSRTRNIYGLAAITMFTAFHSAVGQNLSSVKNPDAGLSASKIAGLYQMIDPRGYADPLAAAVYLRLLPDGRSRLEGILVSDVDGVITSKTEIGAYHRTPWAVRSTAAGPELCFDVAGKSQCAQVERDLPTNDLLLYDTTRPRGRADLRLHLVAAQKRQTGI